jgi:hypothetical protein
MAGGGAAGNYWLEHEYVPVAGLADALNARDIRDLKNDIRSLEYDLDHGGLTEKEEWELDQLRDDLEDLQ